MKLLIFLRSTYSRRFPLGFCCAKIGLALFLNGSVVMIPCLCKRASSTSIPSLRFGGAGGLRLCAALSSLGINLTLKSLLIPMSNRCLVKISLNWANCSSMNAFVC